MLRNIQRNVSGRAACSRTSPGRIMYAEYADRAYVVDISCADGEDGAWTNQPPSV
jgi:hypothetical protein